MGLLVQGQWHTNWYDTETNQGEFVRQAAQCRRWVTADGEKDGFPAESGRYHLFVSYACPWAHRVLIFRALKGLEPHIGVTVVKPDMVDNGWELSDIADPSPVPVDYLYQVYVAHQPDFSGRVTVPVLWDKKTQQIVNNESAEIIRMLNTEFHELSDVSTDYYPNALRADIDGLNEFIYDAINNGVYKAGFATQQDVYEKHVKSLFVALDELDERLGQQRYLVGDQITEADWRLFTTLIRFDAVYVGHFKTNLRTLESYPNLSAYVRDLFQQPKVADTVFFDHIKGHYYRSHSTINPTGIVPEGPLLDYSRPHGRDNYGRNNHGHNNLHR